MGATSVTSGSATSADLSAPQPGPPRRVLVIYYSLSGQTRAVLDEMAERLQLAGHRVDFAPVRAVGGDYRLPYSKWRFFWEWALAWLGVAIRVPVHPLALPEGSAPYDLILLGHQPWYLDTAIPMASWLETDEVALFAGKKVISVMTARTLWQRAYRRAAERIEAAGGEIIDNFVLRNLSPMPANMPITLHFLFEGHDETPKALRRLGRFGVGASGRCAARRYGDLLALRLTYGLLQDTLTHTEGNRQGLLRGEGAREWRRWMGRSS